MATVHALIRGDLPGPVAQEAPMVHPVKRPAGATGSPSPGSNGKASRPRLRQETKRAVQDERYGNAA